MQKWGNFCNFAVYFEKHRSAKMKRQILICFVLITCALGAYAQDSIKISAADLQALIRRVERLEQRDSLSPKVGNVDAMSGATRRVDTTQAAQASAGIKCFVIYLWV